MKTHNLFILTFLSLNIFAAGTEPLTDREKQAFFKKEVLVKNNEDSFSLKEIKNDTTKISNHYKLEDLDFSKPDDFNSYFGIEGGKDKDSFTNYKTDSCTVYKKNITNEDELRADGLRRCKDGTVSFVQPKSTGFCSAEGKCGQTSAANIMYMYCKLITSPKAYTNAYLSDYTPGVRPGTMKKGLNRMFNDNWQECPQEHGRWYYYDDYDNQYAYTNTIERGLKPNFKSKYVVKRTRDNGAVIQRTPVSVLIRNPGGQQLHWITIVDVLRGKTGKNSCHFVVNHWDDQYEVPCSKIAKWSRGVENSYGMVFNKYVVIKFH